MKLVSVCMYQEHCSVWKGLVWTIETIEERKNCCIKIVGSLKYLIASVPEFRICNQCHKTRELWMSKRFRLTRIKCFRLIVLGCNIIVDYCYSFRSLLLKLKHHVVGYFPFSILNLHGKIYSHDRSKRDFLLFLLFYTRLHQ